MASTPHYFRYADARAAFLKRLGNAEHTTYAHPLAGPDGQIAMDIALWEGQQNRDNILIISSGTHGIEGYCGSFIQSALLDSGLAKQLTEHCSLMMIHGVNPYGFAWRRRVNENNVDLNRNFLDHTKPHPENAGYQTLAKLLEPSHWDANTARQIGDALASAGRAQKDNPRWLQSAWSGGQYEFPMGQFYGGLEPQWSNRVIEEVVTTTLAKRDITWIDIHTALGEFGTGQCIVEMDQGSPQLAEATNLWGDKVGNIRSNSSVAIPIAGPILPGVEAFLGRPILGTSLEYGTVTSMEVGGSLIQDQYLHTHGSRESDFGEETKQRMMNAFYPDDQDWRNAVLTIAEETVGAVVQKAQQQTG